MGICDVRINCKRLERWLGGRLPRKPGYLGFDSQWKERMNFLKLSSGFYMHVMSCVC